MDPFSSFTEKRLFLRNIENHSAIPLRGLNVEAVVRNSIAEFKMHQFYENTDSNPI